MPVLIKFKSTKIFNFTIVYIMHPFTGKFLSQEGWINVTIFRPY